MDLRFFGVRGSIPTPGASTVRYGGNTVCVEVRLVDGTLLVLDAGTGIRELGDKLVSLDHRGPITLLLTHLHWDHIMGLPFFAPLYRKETVLRVHPMANDVQKRAVHRRALFDGVHFPVRAADVPATIDFVDESDTPWRVGSASIKRILLNHPGGCQGFRIDDDDGRSLAYLTDNELSPPGTPATTMAALARFAEGVDMMIHDAQYLAEDLPTKQGWGHSTIQDVLELALRSEVRHLVPFHHDPGRDDHTLDKVGLLANHWLREHKSACTATVAREGWRVEL
jgi:phosphoribosyl 1,2-cyclic phosphodiesterase